MESERRIEDKVLTVREEEKKNPSGETTQRRRVMEPAGENDDVDGKRTLV